MAGKDHKLHPDVRVMVLINADGFWARGILQGINDVATAHGWTVLRHVTNSPLADYIRDWRPDALVLSPQSISKLPLPAKSSLVVAANIDMTGRRISSVFVDDEEVGAMAARHLLSKGLHDFACFRFDSSPFAIRRSAGFEREILRGGGVLHRKGFLDGADPTEIAAQHNDINAWLARAPKPLGVLACCDAWARILTCYCKTLGLRIPEDVALIGADNDLIECELTAPPVSSIAIPWRALGRNVGELIEQGLRGKRTVQKLEIAPTDVIERRSSDILAVDDPEVAAAVHWIRKNAGRRVNVPDVVRAIPTYRQRLERRFRSVLGRTINQEIRRAHVDLVRRLLAVSTMSMPEIAERSGFSNATLMGIAFRTETGSTPSEYRRRFSAEAAQA